MENQIVSSVPHEPGIMTPDVTMLILTWVAFISLLIILHKFAWKPILAALDAREQSIRDAVSNADRAKAELEKIQATRDQILSEAESKSKELIEQSRKAAVDAAKVIQQKTREEAQILLKNAEREIKDATERAQSILRVESARIAVELASKLIEENLDDEKNRKIVDEFIKRI